MRPPALLAIVALLAACGGPPAPPPEPQILWAWERPEDFSFLAPGEAKVALLVATITLAGDDLEIYGRRQPLRLPPGLAPIPVVRLETRHPALSDVQRKRLVQELRRRADPRTSPALQIDFDAKKSERVFYRALLDELAAALAKGSRDSSARIDGSLETGKESRELEGAQPPPISGSPLPVCGEGAGGGVLCLSITALASWCFDDPWLAGAPIAEAVPMLFDMGPEGPAVLQKLQRGQDFTEPLCRRSYGVAQGEPWPPFRPGRPLYVFSNRPWTRDRVRSAASSPR